MTTNATDVLIEKYALNHPDFYTADMDDLEDEVDERSSKCKMPCSTGILLLRLLLVG